METGLIPDSVPPNFVGRMSDYALGRQFKTLGDNLDRYGITDWLSERDRSGEGAWGGFIAITDELVGAETKENPEDPMAPTVRLTFDSRAGRRDFCELHCKLQAGITPSSHMPFSEYASGLRPRVTVERFTYPELSTAGRVGTVLLRRHFEDVQDIDVLSQTPVSKLNIAQGFSNTPDALAARIRHQLKVGPASPVSSGHLGIIGRELRAELRPKLPKGKRMPIQRPWGDRPLIEEGAAFFPTKAPVPLSSWSVGRMVMGQLRERAQDITDPYKKGKRNLAKAGEDFLDMATGLGLLQGVSVTARALATIIAAVGVAGWGAIGSIGERRKR